MVLPLGNLNMFQVLAPAVLGMVSDVAAMKSRLQEFQKLRDARKEEEEKQTTLTVADRKLDKMSAENHLASQLSQAEPETFIPSHDTPVCEI